MIIKKIIVFTVLLLITHSAFSQTLSYSKNDLHKIKWIEGKWKGMDGETPFYEIYQIINDTTLMITSYDWNGKDSSNTSTDSVQWKSDAFYLGKNQNWKVTEITAKEIKMMPMKASNDITWKFKDVNNWEAILVNKKGPKTYLMKRFDPFKK